MGSEGRAYPASRGTRGHVTVGSSLCSTRRTSPDVSVLSWRAPGRDVLSLSQQPDQRELTGHEPRAQQRDQHAQPCQAVGEGEEGGLPRVHAAASVGQCGQGRAVSQGRLPPAGQLPACRARTPGPAGVCTARSRPLWSGCARRPAFRGGSAHRTVPAWPGRRPVADPAPSGWLLPEPGSSAPERARETRSATRPGSGRPRATPASPTRRGVPASRLHGGPGFTASSSKLVKPGSPLPARHSALRRSRSRVRYTGPSSTRQSV